MTRLRSAYAEFAGRGFVPAQSAARIWQAWSPDDQARLDLGIFSDVGDRYQALEALDKIRASGGLEPLLADPAWLHRVLLVAGASSTLAQALGRSSELVALLQPEPRERDAGDWARFFADRLPIVDGECHVDPDVLRETNRAAVTLVAARDLSAEDPAAIVESVTLELSHIADQVLATALALARAEVPDWRVARFAVLACGKAGAQELNYLSDVDVVYLVEPSEEGADSAKAIAIGTRLAAAMSRICSAHTRAGTIWPLDAALRPEGKAGPLVRTLASCRAYYDKWAKNWEFQAMLKARPAAGDPALGEAFVEMLAPKVWSAAHAEGFLPEMRAMRERVISLIPAAEADRDVKLAAGGLRDTEFSVQLLQLVHGRADDTLRHRGTLRALEALVAGGYIGRSDGAALAGHYRAQRVLEHRIQLARLRRTHLLPDEQEATGVLARTARIADVDELWRTSRRDVRRLRQRIFFSPLLDVVAGVPAESLLSRTAAVERLQALGFLDARTALAHMEALTHGTSRAAGIRRQLMPAMLEWIADGPNPDFGLLAFRQLSEALGESSWYLRAMRDEGYMAKRLATVASMSRFTVELLLRSPETVRLLASDDELRPRERGDLVDAMRRAANRHDDVGRAIESVRALRRNELCRIALVDVLGGVDIATCGRALSDLAEASVEVAFDLARREIEAPEVGVIALGRWGGRETSYSSDLDCMFVVPDGTDGPGRDAATRLVRQVAQMIGAPGPDQPLVLDSDLRPEGKGGSQVRTVSSYHSYYAKWAATWERQMLLRGRHGAGARDLVETVLVDADPYRYPSGGLTDAQVMEIRRLKSRMEKERIPRGADRSRHLKLGPGGLSDIEWTVQLIQLQHAHEVPALRTTSTLGALEAAREANLIADDDARALRDAWCHTSLVRDAIMLVRGRSSDTLPTEPRDLAAMQALLGRQGPSTQLVEETRRHARQASAVVGRLFWGES